MRLLLCILFFFSYTHAGAQIVPHHYSGDSALMLLVDNGRHNRLFGNMRTLKIHYRYDGQIVKVKGRLFVRSEESVQLKPFGHRDIVIIPVDSIISITPWHRKEKITTAVAAGVGIATFAAATLIHTPSGEIGISIPQFALLFVSEITFWSAVLMLPVDFLGEWLFIRSQKRGYHFSIQKIALEKGFWGELLIPSKLLKPKSVLD